MKFQINKLNKHLVEDKKSSNTLFGIALNAYEYYTKNLVKKINDLMTLSNILIPTTYLDNVKDLPDNLKLSKGSMIMESLLYNIFYINDMILEFLDKKENLIKNNKFPIAMESLKLNLGKEYSKEELGDQYYHCKIKIKKNLVLSEVIVTLDAFYLGEVLSKDFKDLSRIKIFKKILLRNLNIGTSNESCFLNIMDLANKSPEKNIIEMNCLNQKNTKNMYNFLIQNINFCTDLEKSLIISFLEDLEKKIKEYM
jgi:hypothetical protein